MVYILVAVSAGADGGFINLKRCEYEFVFPWPVNIAVKFFVSFMFIVDKQNQLDVTFCILYFSSNSCSTCFGQPCAHHQELTSARCYNLVLVCAVAAGRWSRPVGR